MQAMNGFMAPDDEAAALEYFCRPGYADCVLGGQFGSEGKGAAAAWLAHQLHRQGKGYDVVTTNASSQAGHTAIHQGRTFVTRHLPTAPLICGGSEVYLNAGCAIDPDVLEQEIKDYDYLAQCSNFGIHPNAAIIDGSCIAAENRDDHGVARIGSTRKGVGEAISRKVLRSGAVAADHPYLKQFVVRVDLNAAMRSGNTLLIEIPQGYGLSLNGPFYPYCTSRDCSIMQALSDAHLHPVFHGSTLLVLRTYPIRVGGTSGGGYVDQEETNWHDLRLEPEITTVTKRVRRVFTWSHLQTEAAIGASRPDLIYLSHCDQAPRQTLADIVSDLATIIKRLELSPTLVCASGPTTADARIVVPGGVDA
jgi:adenylosuccinate synthase